MSSRVAYYFAAFAVILVHNVIFPVKGQRTVQGCENGNLSISIKAEIQQLVVEAIRQQQNGQLQSLYELLNSSFQQIKNQQDTVLTSLQAVDRRLNKHDISIKNQTQHSWKFAIDKVNRVANKKVKSINELLNASIQQMKNQQDTFMTGLRKVDRCSQEQDINIKQDQSIHEILNASFEQTKSQHAATMRRLDVIIQLLLYHDIPIKDKTQTQNSWKLAIGGIPVQLQIDVDMRDDLVLLPSVSNWLIIMHRFDESVNFNRNWTEYKNGFGDIGRGEFWLGNEKVHHLTNRTGLVYRLRIELRHRENGRWYYADYAIFSLDSEDNKYTLRLSEFSGNAGDSLTNAADLSNYYLGGNGFSTPDADNDASGGNCAQHNSAGWWFSNCEIACLTCPYNGRFWWASLRGIASDRPGYLGAARMMIKIT